MDSFWNSLGGKLTDRWMSICGAALIFETGGVLAWALRHGGLRALTRKLDAFAAHPAGGQLLALAILVVVTATLGLVVERLTLPVLRLLEGYWPKACGRVRDHLAERFAQRERQLLKDFRSVAEAVEQGRPTSQQRAEHVRLTRAASRLPGMGRHQPTRVGNILRAAEARPHDRYGLDAVSVWPHLWLLLPETTRQEITNSRGALDRAVSAVIWGVFSLAYGVWTVWAAAAALTVALAAGLLWVPARAAVHADLVSAAFDLHRTELYTHLRWPLPQNPEQERQCGALLSTYLVRGLSASNPTFTS
ncbi:hypothetical protein [Streptantibioticus ferralitis]|uniref:Uncharacterized protein n=1 Tax=Streptantibioticus ferralitis TaxID=236510 RepID=A0ABT5ZC24_9ACTN|nr:hypothetical protein [Streptantibioticus ferralitis]MDF2261396.1 hypothetical protein [Streptantibioticus ferralitis]